MQHPNQPNYPLQLQRIPRCRAAAIRAADILIPPPATLKRLTRTDHQAEDASEATIGIQACRCPLECGDIDIACSDGVTDNLFQWEIVSFANILRSQPSHKMAALLARLAYRKSKNKSEKLDTPFRQMWEAHGEECRQGAKEDDITVLVAKVEAGEGNCEEGEAGRRAGWLVLLCAPKVKRAAEESAAFGVEVLLHIEWECLDVVGRLGFLACRCRSARLRLRLRVEVVIHSEASLCGLDVAGVRQLVNRVTRH
mmetsp:Transcript_28745/g.82985  ORF Transcript_28745/g.82985 Transcript_28745/m.82985 type:complete len:254 (+) Transcript_28745:404-1165(+)